MIVSSGQLWLPGCAIIAKSETVRPHLATTT